MCSHHCWSQVSESTETKPRIREDKCMQISGQTWAVHWPEAFGRQDSRDTGSNGASGGSSSNALLPFNSHTNFLTAKIPFGIFGYLKDYIFPCVFEIQTQERIFGNQMHLYVGYFIKEPRRTKCAQTGVSISGEPEIQRADACEQVLRNRKTASIEAL